MICSVPIPNRRAIVVSHFILTRHATFTKQGRAIYTGLKHHANLFLMLGGHASDEEYRVDRFRGHTVHTLLSNYQSRPKGGDGWLRLLEFRPHESVIHVRTYSPTLKRYETDKDSDFIIPYSMKATEADFVLIGSRSSVPSGSTAVQPWSGLAQREGYEWYASMYDGQDVLMGPVWAFATGGKGNNGLAFDGRDDYVSFGAPRDLQLNTFTLETWLRIDGNGTAVSTGRRV